MLKDRFFYPLAALIVFAIVALALSFGERADLTETEIYKFGYTMSGEELGRACLPLWDRNMNGLLRLEICG